MKNKTTVVSYVLAALAGACFISGIALLTDEGGAIEHGVREKTDINA